MSEKYRAYFWTNMYLTGTQVGIQSLHCLSEMFTKYQCEYTPQYSPLYNWAKFDKTCICLKGGQQENLEDIYSFLNNSDFGLPFDFFKEEGLNNTLTCVGVIVPERIWNCSADPRGETVNLEDLGLSLQEYELFTKIKTCSLAH